MWAAVLNFFAQAISISDVAMLAALVWIIRSQQHTKELLNANKELFKAKIETVEKALNNHVTGTESKIRDLKNELKEDNKALRAELAENNRELKEDSKALKLETKEGNARLENKIDKLAEEIRAKDKDKK